MPVTCDTVVATFTYHEAIVAEMTLPAYTRTPQDLRNVLDSHIETYFVKSERNGEAISLANLAMYLCVKSSEEPKEIPDADA